VSCCCRPDCAATARHFDDSAAERDLERYLKSGPDPTTRQLLAALRQADLSTLTLLDVGGGIGTFSFEMLASGLRAATLVDASPSYIQKAEAESLRRGVQTRLKPVVGDFVEIADTVSDADIVVMDRVVCCYSDYQSLLAHALSRCRAMFAISYPRGRWSVRAMLWMENTARRLKKDDFRTFVHPPDDLARIIQEAGFRQVCRTRTWVWCSDVYARAAA
jgi:2-polyprenyl-3-methyl-5-hydroxy-6-metoxy-1,4-benzoquinol methylase